MRVLERMRARVPAILKSRLAQQTGVYSLMQIFSLGFGFLSNVFLAKEMGAERFGIYSFAVAVMAFVSIFFEFGLFSTASKILADNLDKEKERQWLGVFGILFLAISALMSGFIFLIGLFIDDFFADKIGGLLRIVSLLSFMYLLPNFMELVLQGINKIHLLSGYNVIQKTIFFVGILCLWMWDALSPLYLFYALGIASILSFGWTYLSLHPKLDGFWKNLSHCMKYNAGYGWYIYWGRIADTGAGNLDKILVPYFTDARTMGFYSLATAFATPVQTIATSVRMATFRDFASSGKIPQKLIRLVFFATIASIGIVLLMGYLVLCVYLPSDYRSAFFYLGILAIAIGLQSMYQLYNSYLAAAGYATTMRVIAWKTACLDVVTNSTLIPLLGAYGACIATFLEKGFFYFAVYRAYRKKVIC